MRFINYTTSYIDEIVTIHFLNFLRKLIKIITTSNQ